MMDYELDDRLLSVLDEARKESDEGEGVGAARQTSTLASFRAEAECAGGVWAPPRVARARIGRRAGASCREPFPSPQADGAFVVH